MAETFLILLCAHLIGDFVLQTGWIIRNKEKPAVLIAHVAIVMAVSVLLLGAGTWQVYAIILVSHLVMDLVKTRFMDDGARSFIIDQAVHIAAIGLAALFYPGAAGDGWLSLMSPRAAQYYMLGTILAGGLILTVRVGEFVIEKSIRALPDNQLETKAITQDGLKRGGATIGYLERIIIFMLVLVGQTAGVGFLIAAKSILRFSELNRPGEDEANARKTSEYIIIGTMMSFAWGLGASILTAAAIGHYLD